MIEIAVCDNDPGDMNRIRQLMDGFLREDPEAGCVATYISDPDLLYRAVKTGERFDIYMLDIMMPVVNGIEIGRLIRQLDSDAPIIFTTSSTEYALDAYGIHAINYLLKPVSSEDFTQALRQAIVLCSSKNSESLTVRCQNGAICPVKISDLLYVENSHRYPVYHLTSGESITGVLIRRTFEEAVGVLSQHRMFLQPHKSYFVNMKYIHSIEPDTVIMDDDSRIPISQKNGAAVRKEYLDYLSASAEER
jgi:DNA-binding LytR/AlgR family response regulator